MAWGEIISVYIYRLINNCHRSSVVIGTRFIPISRDLEMRTFNENFSLTLCLYLFLPDLKLQNERFVVSRNFCFSQMMMHNVRANAALKCR